MRTPTKFIRAMIIFSPEQLLKHIKREYDGTVYVDRTEIIHNKEEESQFFYMLNRDHLSGYRDIEHLTVYFDIDNNIIMSGAYNTVTKKRVSKRPLISTSIKTPYTCFERDIERYKGIIATTVQNAPQRAK